MGLGQSTPQGQQAFSGQPAQSQRPDVSISEAVQTIIRSAIVNGQNNTREAIKSLLILLGVVNESQVSSLDIGALSDTFNSETLSSLKSQIEKIVKQIDFSRFNNLTQERLNEVLVVLNKYFDSDSTSSQEQTEHEISAAKINFGLFAPALIKAIIKKYKEEQLNAIQNAETFIGVPAAKPEDNTEVSMIGPYNEESSQNPIQHRAYFRLDHNQGFRWGRKVNNNPSPVGKVEALSLDNSISRTHFMVFRDANGAYNLEVTGNITDIFLCNKETVVFKPYQKGNIIELKKTNWITVNGIGIKINIDDSNNLIFTQMNGTNLLEIKKKMEPSYKLEAGREITIGRFDSNGKADIQIPTQNLQISREHLKVYVTETSRNVFKVALTHNGRQGQIICYKNIPSDYGSPAIPIIYSMGGPGANQSITLYSGDSYTITITTQQDKESLSFCIGNQVGEIVLIPNLPPSES